MAELDKKEVRKIITESAVLYKENLVNKNFLVVSKVKNKPYRFWELKFETKQFQHLTGVETNISSTHFYKKATSKRLSINDFEPRKDGTTELKLEILPLLMDFKNSVRMIGEFEDCSPKLYTEVLAGNRQGALGFVEDKKAELVPNTCLNCDTKIRSDAERIVLIASKKFSEKQYSIVEYIANKNFNVEELKAIDSKYRNNLNELFFEDNDEVAVMEDNPSSP